MTSETYSGTSITDLCARVDTVLEVYRRKSSVDKPDGGEILQQAKFHLCYHQMEAGDVQAWYLMADLQDELLLSPTCLAELARNCEDCYPEICGKPTVAGNFCAEHRENL